MENSNLKWMDGVDDLDDLCLCNYRGNTVAVALRF